MAQAKKTSAMKAMKAKKAMKAMKATSAMKAMKATIAMKAMKELKKRGRKMQKGASTSKRVEQALGQLGKVIKFLDTPKKGIVKGPKITNIVYKKNKITRMKDDNNKYRKCAKAI